MSRFLAILLLIICLFLVLSNLNIPIGYKIFLVQSGSMSPTINTGDMVISVTDFVYKNNDIITFVSKNNNITHRIVDIKDNQIYTKGDANKTIDSETIDKKQILGKVFYIIPKFGYFVLFLKSIPGLIILIIIPSAIIVYQEFLKIQKKFKSVFKR